MSDQGTRSKEEVFENITAKKYNYLDYSISVYEVDQRDPACVDREGFSPDGSGCCVAHGGNPSWVGKSWKQILEEQGVQSIIPTELHQRLATQANAGGGWEEYSWATDESAHQTKRAWASRFSSDNHEFYVVVEYFTTKAPPTCNECEDDKTPLCKGLSDDTCDTYMRCENDDQEFCAAYMPEELPGWAIPLFAGVGFFVLLAICGFRQQLQKRNRDIKDALADARIESERSMKKALDEQNQMHELQKKHMVFPVNWHIASEEKIEVDGKEVTVRIPDEGLVDVSPTTAEYWDVYDRLTAKPNPDFARPGPKTGLMSDLDGLSDTWITKLERIQNSDLYTWHDSVKQKLKTSSESANVEADTLDDQGQVKEVLGWHGTGSFDARSIYEDHQDGFMMQVRVQQPVGPHSTVLNAEGVCGCALFSVREFGTVGPWVVSTPFNPDKHNNLVHFAKDLCGVLTYHLKIRILQVFRGRRCVLALLRFQSGMARACPRQRHEG